MPIGSQSPLCVAYSFSWLGKLFAERAKDAPPAQYRTLFLSLSKKGNIPKGGRKRKAGIERWNIDLAYFTPRRTIPARLPARRRLDISTASRSSSTRSTARPSSNAKVWWRRQRTPKWAPKSISRATTATRWSALRNWSACRPAAGALRRRSARASSVRTSPTSPTIDFEFQSLVER